MDNKAIKLTVKEKYGEIAKQSSKGCGCGCGDNEIAFSMVNEGYENLNGYVADADLSLGCGLPTEFANIKQGDVVVDLGSGAGNDVFVARSIAGETGRVIGIDMTEEMIDKANKNKEKLGYKNIEFYLGEIENIPLESNTTDVIISNCVLNLVPDKKKAFEEMYRINKPGGHFCISDIVLKGELPEGLKESAAMYAGCVAGALQMEDYISKIENAGYKEIKIVKERIIEIPKETLLKYLTEAEILELKENQTGIISITVTGVK